MNCIIRLALILSLVPTYGFAQEYSIAEGNIADCGAFIVDTGYSASSYSNGEHHTTTICHDGSADLLVNLYFTVFSLGSGDTLKIYDGNNTSAPLIGSYTAFQLQGTDITSTNVDGCLTLEFTSNMDGINGNFGAAISCEQPCIKPWAYVITDPSTPLEVCQNQLISFNAAPTTFGPDRVYQNATWTFGDGSSSSDWPMVTHAYSEGGGYRVNLSVTDDQGCTSANSIDLLVYVSTQPDINLTSSESTVCINTPVTLVGNATGTTWSSTPTADFGEPQFVPDDQSTCFEHQLIFSDFVPGAVITDVNQIEHFYINFEHSYMGDLSISFICPNGQSINVHQQNSGGTDLGLPTYDDLPGTGWDYFWSPTANNGTWADNATDETLPAGTYASVQSFSSLIGCPLNGEWTIEICDLWSADDGFLFDWSVNMAPELYVGTISFTPQPADGCAGATWAVHPNTDTISGDCSEMIVSSETEGTVEYQFLVTDTFGCAYEASIPVNYVNDVSCSPLINAVDDVFSGLEDEMLQGDVSINDQSQSATNLSFQLIATPSNGNLTLNNSGTFIYTPEVNFNGTVTVIYEVCDELGTCAQATLSLVIEEVNDAPVAIDDVYDINEDAVAVLAILSNDSDVESTLNLQNTVIVDDPSHGLIQFNTNNTISYFPDDDFFGSDSFTYQVCDEGNPAMCSLATVYINVTEINDAPDATDDIASVWEDDDTGVNIDVVFNDFDIEGSLDITSLSITVQPEHGTALIDPSGIIVYTPYADYTGEDSFSYAICDTGSPTLCDDAEVFITVLPVNDPIEAANDQALTLEDEPIQINILGNDADNDGNIDYTSVSIIMQPENGSLSIGNDGVVTYLPNANFNGFDSFTYSVCDDGTPMPATCDEATVFIEVTAVNDPPLVQDDIAQTNINVPVTIAVLDNDSDLDGGLNIAGLSIVMPPAHGQVSIVDEMVIYSPDDLYVGPDAFSYSICDNGIPSPALCGDAQVQIMVFDVRPIAFPDFGQTTEDTSLQLNLVNNDFDPNGDLVASSAQIILEPSYGTVTITNGIALYEPESNWYGTDSFEYQVCDADGWCSQSQVSILVAPVNDGVYAVTDHLCTLVDTPVPGHVLFNDHDPDEDTFFIANLPLEGPLHGTLTSTGGGSFVYSPENGFVGTDSFTYQICDDGEQSICATGTVFVFVGANDPQTDEPPVAVYDIFFIEEGSNLTGNLLANDFDPEAGPFSLSGISQGPGFGDVTVSGSTFVYTPGSGFQGTDSFQYSICDGLMGMACNQGWVFIEPLSPNNDHANDDVFFIREGQSLFGNVRLNDYFDPETLAEVSTVAVQLAGNLEVGNDGNFSYSPLNEDWFGTEIIQYMVCHESGICHQASLYITVVPDNDPLEIIGANDVAADQNGTIQGTTFTMWEDSNLQLCFEITDMDGVGINLQSSSAEQGALQLLNAQCFNYLPNSNFNGIDEVEVVFCDDYGACDTANVIITVLPVNDPPVAIDDVAETDDQTPLVLYPLQNDSDIDGPLIELSGILDEGSGEIVMNGDGSITYIPQLGFCGIDEVVYTIHDNGSPDLFAQASIFISVSVADTDDDGIPDYLEGVTSDTDNDGLLDYMDTDSDNDGIPDQVEANFLVQDLCTAEVQDFDGDGLWDFIDTDSDNDGIPDSIEAGFNPNEPTDTDGDDAPDYLDLDSDGDTIPDHTEAPGGEVEDTDGDGIWNHIDLDSDSDGIPDEVEAGSNGKFPIDTDGEGVTDYLDLDSDADGLTDEEEAGADGWNPQDTDGDGLPDYQDLDSDADSIPDFIEGNQDTDGDGLPDFQDEDSDGDGIPDEIEAVDGDDPIDTDNDGLSDYLDLDSDNDGMLDTDEAGNFFDPVDTDGDGLPDYRDVDSDGDGIRDLIENGYGDCDGDGLANYLDPDDCFPIADIPEGFSPDGDGVADLWEIPELDKYFPEAEVTIFNRWGSPVFAAQPYENNFNGEGNTNGAGTLPSGTYFYTIEFNDGKTAARQGFVYISRK